MMKRQSGLKPALETATAEKSRSTSEVSVPAFTGLQGQYLAFIHYYTILNGYPPAQTDIQRFFRVTPPVIHQMILKLEALGFLSRVPGAARSLKVLIPPEQLPILVARS